MKTSTCYRSSRRLVSTAPALVLAALLLAGCNLKGCLGLEDPIEDWRTTTENVLNDAINALNNASADWQSILRDLQDRLPQEVQSTIRVEVQNLISRSIGQAGVELRCNVDFLRRRVQQGLQRILARFLGQSVPPSEPAICQVVPIAVERANVPARIPQLEFYGYDFDQASDLKVFHVRTHARQDVTNQLDRPTHYAMTLRFGATGVQLDDRSQRFTLEWGGQQISSIAIIQPQTPVCRTRTENFQPTPVTFVPPHTRGDRDFAGHGPTTTARVTRMDRSNDIRVEVYMKAYESHGNNSPQSDHTTAEGRQVFPLYNAPPGWRIDRVAGPVATSHTYRDSNHTEDSFDMGSGGPVRRFVFVGDTRGDEAGTRTKVEVTFNRFSIELVETGNCVAPRAVMALSEANLLTAATSQRLVAPARRALESLPVEAPPDSLDN